VLIFRRYINRRPAPNRHRNIHHKTIPGVVPGNPGFAIRRVIRISHRFHCIHRLRPKKNVPIAWFLWICLHMSRTMTQQMGCCWIVTTFLRHHHSVISVPAGISAGIFPGRLLVTIVFFTLVTDLSMIAFLFRGTKKEASNLLYCDILSTV